MKTPKQITDLWNWFSHSFLLMRMHRENFGPTGNYFDIALWLTDTEELQ